MYRIKTVETASEAAMHEQLRYSVYCEEKGWLPASNFPDKRERDPYDEHAVRYLALSMSAEPVGTMRLILDGKNPLPVEELFDISIEHDSTSAEISRLTIAPAYRSHEHRVFLALCRAAFDDLLSRDIAQVYSIIEQPLLEMLHFVGFPFEPLGGPKQVWGDQTMPCVCKTDQVISSLKLRDEETGLGVANFFEKPFLGSVR